MAAVEPNDVCAVAIIGDVDGTEEIVQSYQFRLGNAFPAQSIAQAFSDWEEIFSDIWDIIKSLFTVYVAFRKIRARNITQGTLLGEQSFSTAFIGLNASDQAPFQCTLPVSFSTTVPRVVLKKMLGPVGISVYGSQGYVLNAQMTVAATYAAFMLATLVATNGSWAYGYFSPIAAGFVEPIAGSVTKKPGALGRRRAGRGS